MKKLLYRGIFWRGLNYLAVFLVTITVARVFQAKDSGLINYALNNLALVVLVISFSLESATAYFIAKGTLPRSELLGITLLMSAWCIIISLPIIHWLLRIDDASALTGCILYCGGVVLCNYFNALYYVQNQYVFPNLTTVLFNLLVVLICLTFRPVFSNRDASIFILFYGAAFFVNGLILAAGYLHRNEWELSWPALSTAKQVFRLAGLAVTANIVFFLVYRVDYWFVQRNSSAADLGNYIQVSKLGQIFLLLPGVIGTVVFSRTASNTSVDGVRELQVLSRLLMMAYTFAILLLLVTGHWLFPFIYGDSFDSMYLPFLLLCPGILSLSTLTLISAYNGGQGNIALNVRGALVALVVIVAGNAIFSPKYGIYAAAATSSVGYIVYQVYIMLMIKRRNPDLQLKAFFLPGAADFTIIKNLFAGNEKN
ncbi:MATE family efflux transporter [Flavitalea antarctica]